MGKVNEQTLLLFKVHKCIFKKSVPSARDRMSFSTVCLKWSLVCSLLAAVLYGVLCYNVFYVNTPSVFLSLAYPKHGQCRNVSLELFKQSLHRDDLIPLVMTHAAYYVQENNVWEFVSFSKTQREFKSMEAVQRYLYQPNFERVETGDKDVALKTRLKRGVTSVDCYWRTKPLLVPDYVPPLAIGQNSRLVRNDLGTVTTGILAIIAALIMLGIVFLYFEIVDRHWDQITKVYDEDREPYDTDASVVGPYYAPVTRRIT